MEKKKSENADIGKGRVTAFLIGIIFGLAVMYCGLEWTQHDKAINENAFMVHDVSFDTELVPITLPEKKTVPPPPQAVKMTDIIQIIEDDADIAEDEVISTEDQEEWVDITAIDHIEVDPEPEDDTPFMVVEDMPEFPGGTKALLEYLSKNIKYPSVCRENNIQGKVIISFIVDKDGSITNPEVIKSINPYLDKEALRVITNMPKWKPGSQRGKAVKVRFTVPVQFKLN